MGDRNCDKHKQKRNKKQMRKLQSNYFIAFSLQIICKHNKETGYMNMWKTKW